MSHSLKYRTLGEFALQFAVQESCFLYWLSIGERKEGGGGGGRREGDGEGRKRE
jgi:hypothetical protein